jgi:hypothetical protein
MATPLLPRHLVESDRTTSPNPGTQAARWKTTAIRPGLPRGRLVRIAQRDSLADAATGNELRFGNELLGEGYATGKRRASGSSYILFCWTGWRAMARLNGHGLS